MKQFFYSFILGVIIWGNASAQTDMPSSGSASYTITSTGMTLRDPGGAGNYTNSTTSEVTLCPQISTEKVRIRFTAFNTQASTDYVYVYHGTSSGVTPAATLSGVTTPKGIASTAANGCLTIKFTSDASTVSTGFLATVESINFACGTGNTTPTDACSSAPLISNLSGFCGTTLGSYTIDGTFTGCAASYSIDNSSWLRFTASGSTAVIDYAITGGTSCGGATGNTQSSSYGAQFAVVSGTCGTTMTSLACAPNATGGIGASGTWNISGLTSGTTYYLFMDGYGGDVCNYSFAGQSGILACDISSVTVTPSACSGGLYSLSGIASYTTPPSSGNLLIKVDGTTMQTIAMPGGGWGASTAYNVTGLTADGASHTVTAQFSANTGCTGANTYTSPAACSGCSASSGMTLTLTPN